MYLFPLLEVVGNHLHRSEYIFPSLGVLGSVVVRNTTFFLIMSSRYMSKEFFRLYTISSHVQVYHCRVP